MTKASLFYHDTRNLLNNKDTHSMVNDSHSPIPQVQGKKKGYTNRDIKGMIVQGNYSTVLVRQ